MQPEVTIIVVPHEQYNIALKSLDSILKHTEHPFNLVYVDVNSPKYVLNGLKKRQKKHHFIHIRIDHYIQPNVARNIGLEKVKTPYLVFIDNDVMVSKGWLEQLLQCAKETGAWLVGPLILESDGKKTAIHSTVTEAHFDDSGIVLDHMIDHKDPLKQLTMNKRQPSELLENHCILIKSEGLESIGGKIDEGIKNTRSHMDLCFRIKNAGGKIYYEPDSQVNYLRDYPIEDIDDENYIKFRYKDEETIESIKYFEKKWKVKLEPNRLDTVRRRRDRKLNNKKNSLLPRSFKNIYSRISS